MNSVQHALTVGQLIEEGAAAFEAAGVWFGHGSDNALDEAAELVFYGADIAHEEAQTAYGREVDDERCRQIRKLFERRVRERIPAAYLTRRMWFAGHEFYIDERVLVPRSPLAELIEARFEPWIGADSIRRVLDIGSGSGCIAIAAALALPEASVDAADISEDALAVARINIARHRLGSRVRAIRSDVFEALEGQRYDVIVSNPPYVGREELAALPREYSLEPRLGLDGGEDGLQIVHRILQESREHLTPHGVLIVEVGNTEDTLIDAYPRLPFVWLEFERGGGGVFVLTARDLDGDKGQWR